MAEIHRPKFIKIEKKRLSPALHIMAMSAMDDGGQLVWGESETNVWTGEDGALDPRRFDAQIAEKFARMARAWTTDPKAKKHLKRALKAIQRGSNG